MSRWYVVNTLTHQETRANLNLERQGSSGVRRLLCLHDRPAPVPDEFIEALRPGQKVALLAGPFVDCVATIVNCAAKDRISVLLELLGREVATVVSRQMVAPAA